MTGLNSSLLPIVGLQLFLLISASAVRSQDVVQNRKERGRRQQETAEIDSSRPERTEAGVLTDVLKKAPCDCGCHMGVAECLAKDPKCQRSRQLQEIASRKAREGVKEVDILDDFIFGDYAWIPLTGSPAKGASAPLITIIEFGDFECGACAQSSPQIASILEKHGEQIRFIFKQYPLQRHPNAELAAEASLAALSQNRFWEMYDALFSHFQEINRENLLIWAQEIGLDVQRFQNQLNEGTFKQAVEEDKELGNRIGVKATPTFFVNGRRYNGALTLHEIESLVLPDFEDSDALTALVGIR